MSRTLTLVLLAISCVAISAGCAASETRAQSASSETIVSEGVTRNYLLYEPTSLPAGKVALMIALHGGFGSPQGMESLTGFDELADKDRFIVAYPEAESGIWHLGCCNAERSSPDDVDFISALIAHLVRTANVDPNRVYVTGFSVGAGMAYRLACELSSQIVGMGSVGGYEYLSKPCAPEHPVTIYEIHGTRDYFGGSCGGKTETNEGCHFGQQGYEPSVREVNAQWRGFDGCTPEHSTTSFTATLAVTRETWEGCMASSAVRLDVITEGSHCWPGPSATGCSTYSASEALWSFLSAHPRPPGKTPEEEGEEEERKQREEEQRREEEQERGREKERERESPGGGKSSETNSPPGGGGSPGGSGSTSATVGGPASVGGGDATRGSRSAKRVTRRCRVPFLLGRSARVARRLVAHSGCLLGVVSRERRRPTGGALLVRSQRPGGGSLHATRTKVYITLGAAPRNHRHG